MSFFRVVLAFCIRASRVLESRSESGSRVRAKSRLGSGHYRMDWKAALLGHMIVGWAVQGIPESYNEPCSFWSELSVSTCETTSGRCQWPVSCLSRPQLRFAEGEEANQFGAVLLSHLEQSPGSLTLASTCCHCSYASLLSDMSDSS